jgi:hypothetical protein
MTLLMARSAMVVVILAGSHLARDKDRALARRSEKR